MSAGLLIRAAVFGCTGQALRSMGRFRAALPWQRRAVENVERFEEFPDRAQLRTTWTYLQQERLFRDAQEARASANLLSGVFTFPRFQEFWEVYRPTLAASSFYMERDSRLGRTCYKTIPPIWLPAAPIASHDLTQAWIEALDSPALPTRRVPSDAWLDSVLANLRLTVI